MTLIFLQACAKSNYKSKALPLNPIDSEYAKTLVNKTWQEVSIETINDDQNTIESKNITGQFLATDLDDEILFFEDGTYTYDEGKTKAKKESSQLYENGNWQLREGELVLTTKHFSTSYQVIEISPTKMVLELLVKNEDYHYLLIYKAI